MSIYFRNTPVSAPLHVLSLLGNHWNQGLISSVRTDIRIIITSRLKRVPDALKSVENFILSEPTRASSSPPVSLIPYHRESTSWTTMFATFTGTLAGSIPSMTDNQEVILSKRNRSQYPENDFFYLA